MGIPRYCRYCLANIYVFMPTNHYPDCRYYVMPKSREQLKREKMEEQKRLPFLNEEGWDL